MSIRIIHPLLFADRYRPLSALVALEDWWRQRRRGVALLSGVGGAGKTATIDALLPRRGVLASATLPEKGDSDVLVFSFSEGTPEQLRDELRSWASSSSEDLNVTGWHQVLRIVEDASQARSGMTIILDALERIQAPASAGAQVTDVGVRELLSRTAYGANRLAVLETTRYPIADARLLKQPLWNDVAIEPLSVEEGIALLRSRGWTGSVSRLRAVVERFGGHPLTLDYALPASDAELPAEAHDVFAEYERVIAKSDEPKTTFSALWTLSALAGAVTAEELAPIRK